MRYMVKAKYDNPGKASPVFVEFSVVDRDMVREGVEYFMDIRGIDVSEVDPLDMTVELYELKENLDTEELFGEIE